MEEVRITVVCVCQQSFPSSCDGTLDGFFHDCAPQQQQHKKKKKIYQEKWGDLIPHCPRVSKKYIHVLLICVVT